MLREGPLFPKVLTTFGPDAQRDLTLWGDRLVLGTGRAHSAHGWPFPGHHTQPQADGVALSV